MFNSNNVPSVADIAAVTNGNGRNDGWANDWWPIILLIALFGGFGRGGFFGGGYGGGEVLPETTIIVTEDTVGSLDNVAAHTFFKNCCGDYDRITLVNTGTIAAVVDANSAFSAKRLA